MKLFALLMMAVDLNGQPLPEVVLLDFTAGYCQPCRQMVPVLQRMENDKYPIRKIDITQHPDISRKYNVDRIPTLILMVDGQEVKRFQGVRSEKELRQAMNDAARKLDQRRNPNTAPPEEIVAATQPPETNSATENEAAAPRPGIRGIFDKMRKGFGKESPEPNVAANTAPPEFRAQSPENTKPPAIVSPPMRATVRVRLKDGDLRDVGTGTIIQSSAGQSTILTCAHIFQKVNDQAVVEVDIFLDGKALMYPAEVLGGDHESDVALLRIRNTAPLPTVTLATSDDVVKKNEALFSIGCSNGDVPTRLNMNVIEVDRYDGPQNILCTNDPAQGRSGGGLFGTDNQVVGVCSAADRDAHEGLYTGIKPVRKLISQLKLDSLFEEQESVFATAEPEAELADIPPSPFAAGDEMFDEFFDEEATLTAFEEEVSTNSTTEFEQLVQSTQDGVPTGQSLPDPFKTASTGSQTAMGPTEITVIFDDDKGGRRMVVIPKPSPWLMELLTGEKPTAKASNLATARQGTLSATSARSDPFRVTR